MYKSLDLMRRLVLNILMLNELKCGMAPRNNFGMRDREMEILPTFGGKLEFFARQLLRVNRFRTITLERRKLMEDVQKSILDTREIGNCKVLQVFQSPNICFHNARTNKKLRSPIIYHKATMVKEVAGNPYISQSPATCAPNI
jgi:hypothetical protein